MSTTSVSSVQSATRLVSLLLVLGGCSPEGSSDAPAWSNGSNGSNAPNDAAITDNVAHSDTTEMPAKTDDQPAKARGADQVEGEVDATQAPPALNMLQWKRGAALEADLARALELPADSLCREFGSASCVRDVHLVPLGGSNPFTTGMFEPAAEPLASTPTVVERVVLSACAQRAELDREAGSQAKVFAQFSLAAGEKAPAPDDEKNAALVRDLYRRLLSRDPQHAELETVGTLAEDESGEAVAAADFAKLACFTIGSSAEFLFF